MTLDPAPLFTGNDPAYRVLFEMVTNHAIEEFNRVHGGG